MDGTLSNLKKKRWKEEEHNHKETGIEFVYHRFLSQKIQWVLGNFHDFLFPSCKSILLLQQKAYQTQTINQYRSLKLLQYVIKSVLHSTTYIYSGNTSAFMVQ